MGNSIDNVSILKQHIDLLELKINILEKFNTPSIDKNIKGSFCFNCDKFDTCDTHNKAPDKAPDKAPVITPDKASIIVPDKAHVITPDKASIIVPDKAPVIVHDKAPVIVPNKTHVIIPDKAHVIIHDKAPVILPDKAPVIIPDKTSDIAEVESTDNTAQNINNDEQGYESASNNIKCHNCLKCGKSFKYKSLLNKHLTRKTPCDPFVTVASNDLKLVAAKLEKRVCLFCNRIYSSTRTLNVHIKSSCPIALAKNLGTF
jgi:hypothetical protein